MYEQEVRIEDSLPSKSNREDSISGEDNRTRPSLENQHSTPIADHTKIGGTINEDFKSEAHELRDISPLPKTHPKNTTKAAEFNNCIVQLDPDTISHRLIESVSMVTDLLQSNRQLRDSINMLNKEKELIENDNCILQSDNLELRDRIEILESIIRANASDYENYDWRKIIEEENELNLESFKNSNNKGVENVATTMVEIKKENRMLKRRIEHLELQISHLTNHFDFQGNIEPTRALVGQNNDQYIDRNPNDYVPEKLAYNDGSWMGSNPGMSYNNDPSTQYMRSTGFSKGTRTKLASKSSLRESVGKRVKRSDVIIRNASKNKK